MKLFPPSFKRPAFPAGYLVLALLASSASCAGNCTEAGANATSAGAPPFDKKEELRNRLLSVFMLFRHGARTPNRHTTVGYKESNLGKPGMLTPVGADQLLELGRRAFRKYDIFEPNSVIFISSFRDRNRDSLDNFLQPYIEFATRQGFGEDAIRIFYTHKDSDFLFHSQFFDARFKQRREDLAEDRRVKIEALFELARDLRVEPLLAKYHPTYKAASAYDKLVALSHLYTTLHCNEVNGIDPAGELDAKLAKVLEYAFSFQAYQINYKQENFRRRRTNEILILLGKQILAVVKPFKNYEALYYKYFKKFSNTIYEVEPAMFLSAHDTNIMGLLSVLLDPDELTNDRFYIPDFASYIKFELLDVNEKDYFVELGHGIEGSTKAPSIVVKIKYGDHEVLLRRCNMARCDLAGFLELLDQNTSDCHWHECIRDIHLGEIGEFAAPDKGTLI